MKECIIWITLALIPTVMGNVVEDISEELRISGDVYSNYNVENEVDKSEKAVVNDEQSTSSIISDSYTYIADIVSSDGSLETETPRPEARVEPAVSEKCSNDVNIIESSADLIQLHDCERIVGDVIVRKYNEPFMDFGKIKAIGGNLQVSGAPNLVRIEAPHLNMIGKSFSLNELTSLTLVSFPILQSVDTIDWRVLPILSTVRFNQGISNIRSITISDTSLTGFSGFAVDNLDTLNINNNRFLEQISSSVKKISGRLLISANARDVIVELPLLRSVNNMTLHDVASIDLGSLELIESSVSFISNYFSSLKLPKLRSVGGTLSISENERLDQVEFPSMTEIGGGLKVVNNSMVDKINFFPKLAIIGGAIEFVGNIKDASLSKLKLVKGSAIVQSTAKIFDCSKWTRSEISSVIRGGRIECTNSDNEKIVNTIDASGESTTDYYEGSTDYGSFKQGLSIKNVLTSSGVQLTPWLGRIMVVLSAIVVSFM